MALVSVVVPAYNVAPYLAAAIDSALAQSHPELETIVVNDGSTDETAALLESYGDRIVRVDQENRGLAAAKNAGIGRARGEFIAFLDGDDRLAPEFVAQALRAAQGPQSPDIVASDAWLVQEKEGSGLRTYYRSRPASLRFRNRDQSRWIVQYNFILGFTLCRAHLFERNGMFDETLRTFEDWDFWLRAIVSGAAATLIPDPLAFYRLRTDSLTSQQRQLASDEVRLLEKAAAMTPSPIGSEARLRYAKAKRALIEGDLKAARSGFAAAATGKALHPRFRVRALLAAALPALALSRVRN